MRVQREDLLEKLELVEPGLSTRRILEQADHFIFQGNQIRTLNDEISCRIPTDLDVEGAVIAQPVLALLRKMEADDKLDIYCEDGGLYVVGRNKKGCFALDREILIDMGVVEKPKKWHRVPKGFLEAIDLVKECAGSDESSWRLTCLHLTPKVVEACDRSQAAQYKVKLPFAKPCLARRTSIGQIPQFGVTEVAETPTWLHFRNPKGLVFSCRKHAPDGEFPELNQYMKVSGERIVLPTDLGETLDRAEILSEKNLERNFVTVHLRPGKMRIKGSGPLGWYQETRSLKYKGRPTSFIISPRLLRDLVKKHTACELSEDKLKVQGPNFRYIAVLYKDPETNGED